MKSSIAFLTASLLTVPVAAAWAQNGTSAAVPLTTAQQTSKDQNPNVRGATGEAIVKGDRSTIKGDKSATSEQKKSTAEAGQD